MKKSFAAILFVVLIKCSCAQQQFLGYVFVDDSFPRAKYMAEVEVTENDQPFATLKTYFDGSFKFQPGREKTYKIQIHVAGFRDTAYTITSNKAGQPDPETHKVILVRDGIRLTGMVKSVEEDFPIAEATIVVRNIMTREEDRYTTNIDGIYNFKLEYETNYRLSLDKRSPGLLNKYQDTAFYVSTVNFNRPATFKLDIALNDARKKTILPEGYDAERNPVNRNLKPVVQVKSAADSTNQGVDNEVKPKSEKANKPIAEKPAPKPLHFTITVTDYRKNKPVKDATVRIKSLRNLELIKINTSGSGKCNFDLEADKKFVIVVSHPGFYVISDTIKTPVSSAAVNMSLSYMLVPEAKPVAEVETSVPVEQKSETQINSDTSNIFIAEKLNAKVDTAIFIDSTTQVTFADTIQKNRTDSIVAEKSDKDFRLFLSQQADTTAIINSKPDSIKPEIDIKTLVVKKDTAKVLSKDTVVTPNVILPDTNIRFAEPKPDSSKSNLELTKPVDISNVISGIQKPVTKQISEAIPQSIDSLIKQDTTHVVKLTEQKGDTFTSPIVSKEQKEMETRDSTFSKPKPIIPVRIDSSALLAYLDKNIQTQDTVRPPIAKGNTLSLDSSSKNFAAKDSSSQIILRQTPVIDSTAPKNEVTVMHFLIKDALYKNPLKGVSVTVRNIASGQFRQSLSNEKGEVMFSMNSGKRFSLVMRKTNYRNVSDTINISDAILPTISKEYFLTEAITDTISSLLPTYFFDKNSSSLSEAAKAEIRALLKYILKKPNVRIKIYGLSTYDEDNAEGLALRRMDAVAGYIIQLGLNGSQLTSCNVGTAKPRKRCNVSPCPEIILKENRCVVCEVIYD